MLTPPRSRLADGTVDGEPFGSGLGPVRRLASVACGFLGAMVVIGLAGCERRDGEPPAPTSERQSPTTPPRTASAAEIAQAREAAEKALDDGRVDDAERLAAYLSERDPSGSGDEVLGRVWLVRAAQAVERGDGSAERTARQRAADAYRRAALADPTNAGLQDAAGRVLDAAGLLPEAIAHYTRALALDPKLASTLLHRGNAHLRGGDRERAEQDARSLEQLAPREPWTHALLAELALAREDHATAAARARTARELAPNDIAFRVLHARALRLGGDASAAVELLIGLEASERANRSVAGELAAGWTSLGRPADARDVWANVYRLGAPPSRFDAAIRAGNAAIDAGDLVDAERWLTASESMRRDADEDRARIVDLRTRLTQARIERASPSP
jgi:Flp pilus assembly protein TadD